MLWSENHDPQISHFAVDNRTGLCSYPHINMGKKLEICPTHILLISIFIKTWIFKDEKHESLRTCFRFPWQNVLWTATTALVAVMWLMSHSLFSDDVPRRRKGTRSEAFGMQMRQRKGALSVNFVSLLYNKSLIDKLLLV